MARAKKTAPKAEPEIIGEQAYAAAKTGATSRWFRVTAERFDWLFAPNKMKAFRKGQIAYEPLACVEAGLSIGAIETIEKPANARVGKDGRVVFDAD
ncbi:hypothetical protein NKH73_14170 [Mesorhizobium sp. M0938]|uniref:hypothetical protein n=1 Tax=unclassified Mesorhizobium TaxID=325217 RepID=UPI00333D6BB5